MILRPANRQTYAACSTLLSLTSTALVAYTAVFVIAWPSGSAIDLTTSLYLVVCGAYAAALKRISSVMATQVQ